MKYLNAILLITFLFQSGCILVDSNNKVSHDGSSTPDVTKLVGTWRAVTLNGGSVDNTDGYTDLVISNPSGNTISGVLKQDGIMYSNIGIEITNIGSIRIFSMKSSSEGTWSFAKYTLTGSDDTLNIFFPDIDEVIADVDGSTLAGEVIEYDTGSNIIKVTASSSALRSYISSNSNIFPSTPVLIFDKQ